MKINLLGPLEVIEDGAEVTPSAPKLRRVLALLAINANNVVRADQLIEELWDDRPPFSATTTLQTYVYQLRKMHQLGGGARTTVAGEAADVGPTLHTSPSGYVLSLPRESLDMHRFAMLADQGQAELESGDLERASATLHEALRLWRGPALTDVRLGPVLQAAVVWLEELHKRVMEQRINVDLQLGKHSELIVELTGMVAEQPTHEGFQAKLMQALYWCGRRSEALLVYQRARQALADELGLEPSPELQRVHRGILAADPALDAPLVTRGSAPAVAAVSPPSQLPPDVPVFVGRDGQVSVTTQMLSDRKHSPSPVVVALGPPGSGKSAFCTHVAHKIRADYLDGQFHATLTGPSDTALHPADVLAEFLRTVGVAEARIPCSLRDRAAMFRSWTANRKVLVVLDDVVSTFQLRALLPTGPECGVLVASRRRLSDPSITGTVGLGPFGDEDGLRLLTSVLGPRRVSSEPDAARELVCLCSGLPLVLRWAASQLEVRPHWSIRRLVGRIRCGIAREQDNDLDIEASVRRTYRLLPERAQAAFRMMACADQSVAVRTAASQLGIDEPTAESALEALVQFQLAEVDEPEDSGGFESFRYRFRPPFRDVARSLEASWDWAHLQVLPRSGKELSAASQPA